MTREFNVVIEKDEDGYFVASVPAVARMPHASQIPGCVNEACERSYQALPRG